MRIRIFFIIPSSHQVSFLWSSLCPLSSFTLAIFLIHHGPYQRQDPMMFSLISLPLHMPITLPGWTTFYLLPCLLFDHWALQTRLNTFIHTLSNACYVPDTALALEFTNMEGQRIQWHQTSPVLVRVRNWMQQSTCVSQPLDTLFVAHPVQVNTGVLLFEVNQEPRLTRLPSPGSPLDNDQQTREGSKLGRAPGVFRRCPEMIELHCLLVELL